MAIIPKLISDMTSRFEYADCWKWIESTGKAKYGSGFKLLEEDANVILRLMVWSLQDKELADVHGIDLKKGILLNGAVGCGKTSLMTLLSLTCSNNSNFFKVRSCREIAFEFAKYGHSIFSKYYSKASMLDNRFTGHYCFDDLGRESEVSYFGNSCNVMEEILLSRYDVLYSLGLITHVTTNLNSDQIEERYGICVRSRCKVMFNLISFDNCMDKREFQKISTDPAGNM